MRGHLVGFHFCPILLSGVALFLVAFSSSLHTDLSRDEVFERVEGNTWMCYTSVITPWYFFPTFCTLLIPLYTLLATTNPSFRRNVNVSGAMGEESDRMTDFGCHDKLYIHIHLYTYTPSNTVNVNVSIAMGENSDRMTQILVVSR